VRLTALAPNLPAYIDAVDWTAMSDTDGKRLRELGLCEGASVELLHRSLFRGVYACRVGRMIVAMRAAHAGAVTVRSQAELASEVNAA
jgi:ferrous iron transport protein A